MVNVTGGRPGVFQPETDISQVVREAASDVGVIVGTFPRGPINKRILITNTGDMNTLFGDPNPSFGYASYCANCALETMNQLYVTRVAAPDALSSALIVNDSAAGTATELATNGLSEGIQEVGIATVSLINTGDGVTTVFAGTLGGAEIDSILSIEDIVVGGTSVGPLTVDTNVMPWTIAGPGLTGTSSTLDPNTKAFSFDFAVAPATGEEIQAFFTAESADRLFTVAAENPGLWGNALKVAVENINATDSTFELVVFETVDGTDIELQRFLVSRKMQLDGFGRQQYLEDVINGNNIYIRVYDNLAQVDTELPQAFAATNLSGGDDGSAISNGDVIEGWDIYSNKQDIQIDILINGGFVSDLDFTVQSKIKSLCESRDDCFGILDAPFESLSMFPTTDLTDWRNTTQNFNSSYVALYAPWCEVYDSFNDSTNFPIPPSGFVAQVFSRRANNTEAWFPPAGFNDGIIDSGLLPFTRLTHRYTDGQQDAVYSNGVNFLLTEPGTGTAVFGDKTQQTKASALDRINVRRLLNILKRAMRGFLKFKLFELNTEFTRADITQALTDFLNGIVARQGLTDFRVVCNDINNPGSVIDNNQLNVDVYIQPTRSINFIKNEFIITRTGVDFDQIINARIPE
ncbi:MAG: hypothetical protein HKO92_06525 [Flavobacteriaceae bacterium]|nr:hypothetical protein [Flavobacteriaceae bacterium]